MIESLETSEREAIDPTEALIRAKGLTAPRVTPAQLEAEIASEHYFTGAQGHLQCALDEDRDDEQEAPLPLHLLTLCVLVLHNGFTVVGKSACASPENFDAEIGRQIARKDAISQLWPLLGFRLRDRLLAQAHPGSA